ncbi:uncharacterized protein [Zea mays]|uniref:uncharacterized protein n=1 Tax=Zea mays TaxID=4577 RepID=UPI0009A9C2E6|nr:uncharacterized protein LOC109941958 [Zea mays]|eukprot:XP_020398830.1 uncharacterized protein LOC109941958 [Zea mays]
MSKKVKQLAKGLARRASIFGRKEDLVFQGTSSSSSRRRALLEHVPELQGQAVGVQRNEDEPEDEEETEEWRQVEDEEETGWGEWPNDGGSGVGGASGSREGEAGVSGAGSGSGGVGGSSRVRKPRKTSWVPPPKEPVNKVEIIPSGDGAWLDSSFTGKDRVRQVNKVLGNICRMRWPGLVIENGIEVPVTRWDQYGLAVNAQHGNAQGAVWHDFWVCLSIFLRSYQLNDCFILWILDYVSFSEIL